jgi:hypothetical protein
MVHQILNDMEIASLIIRELLQRNGLKESLEATSISASG